MEKIRQPKPNILLANAMAIAAALSSNGVDELLKDITPATPKKRMPLSKDEEEKLASLSGKEKKQFVKELKEKYQKSIAVGLE